MVENLLREIDNIFKPLHIKNDVANYSDNLNSNDNSNTISDLKNNFVALDIDKDIINTDSSDVDNNINNTFTLNFNDTTGKANCNYLLMKIVYNHYNYIVFIFDNHKFS